jgi:hypothetical protein
MTPSDESANPVGAKHTRRRRFLTVLGALGVTGAAGCAGGGDGTPTDTDRISDDPSATEDDTTDPGDTDGSGDTDDTTDTDGDTDGTATPHTPGSDRLVGTHYYPWYNVDGDEDDWMEDIVSTPVLGEYAADDPSVVNQHLAWCLNHGIRWLSTSWWGPGSDTDVALRDAVLEADRAEEMGFSILYETVGRLGEYDYDLDEAPARERLRADLEYLDAEYFGRDNYLYMDGRPVVFLYVANLLTGAVESAFEEAAVNLTADPFILADIPFGTPLGTHPMSRVADGVTTYNPYTARPDIEDVFHDLYDYGNEVMHLGADAADVAYVPAVIPGYDDTGLPDSQREDNPVLAPSPDRYERVCEQVSPHLKDASAVLVTSFNEWFEDTQIEPDDTHGTAYLELTEDRLVRSRGSGYTHDGVAIRFAFNRTVVPAEENPESSDTRQLAFMTTGVQLLDDGTEIRSYPVGDTLEGPLFVEGAYAVESNDDLTWRWFGGVTDRTTLFVDAEGVASASTLSLVGRPIRPELIEAEVSVGGTTVGNMAFQNQDGIGRYTVQL